MNVREIVEKYLKDNNFDGLFSEDECACGINDLMSCCVEGLEFCEPGYQTKCDCGDHDYHISASKDPRDHETEE